VLGKIAAQMRRVPSNVDILSVTNTPTISWVREGYPTPVGAFSLNRVALIFHKLAGVAVFTRELAFSSAPQADVLFGAELERALVEFTDRQFLSPDAAPVADVSPGGISYNASISFESTGTSAAAVVADLNRLFGAYDSADGALDNAVLAMHPRSARFLGSLLGANGGLLFPAIGARGGFVWGVPVLVSSACSLIGSPSETFAVLLDPQQLMLSDDGDIVVESTNNATLQMDTAPASGATTNVDLWGNGLRALKVERSMTWQRQSANSVSVLRGCAW
jgi:HK97 family phage major capsid protein